MARSMVCRPIVIFSLLLVSQLFLVPATVVAASPNLQAKLPALSPEDAARIQQLVALVAKADADRDSLIHDTARSGSSSDWMKTMQSSRDLAKKATDEIVAMGPAAVPAVIPLIDHQSREVALMSTQILGRIGSSSVMPIIVGLRAGKIRNIHWAQYALKTVGSDAIPALLQLIASPSEQERLIGVGALADMYPRREHESRSSASEETVSLPPAAMPKLLGMLANDKSAKVRKGVAILLGRMANAKPQTIQALGTVLKKETDSAVRVEAVTALGYIGARLNVEPAQSVAKIIAYSLAKDDSDGVRLAAATSMAAVKGAPTVAVPALKTALKDPIKEVSQQALKSLSSFGQNSQAALPELIAALGGGDSRQTSSALRSLVQLGPAAAPAVPTLRALLKSPNVEYFTKKDCVKCLGRIGASAAPAVPEMIPLLSDKEDLVREETAKALGMIGPGAKGAQDALTKMISVETRHWTKKAAEEALQQIAR